jgi:hypothetical protein
VQREAKRVAEMAAAAVMAAANSSTDTGEFPRVVLPSDGERNGDRQQSPVPPPPMRPINGHPEPGAGPESGVPIQRAPQPVRVATDNGRPQP